MQSIWKEVHRIHKDIFKGTQWEAYPSIYWEIYHYINIKIREEIVEE